MKIFTVYDSKAEAFLQPFFLPAAGAAIRACENALKQSDHPFSLSPGDYTLFEIGSWDATDGVYIPHDAHVNLGNLISLMSFEGHTPPSFKEINSEAV